MGGTKQLTDKSHRDGSPTRRNCPDVAKKSLEAGVVLAGNRRITTERTQGRSAKKSGGTSMKMLIAQEMSKETESKKMQTNIVAKLMGLDEPLPDCHSVLNAARSLEKSFRSSRVTLAGALQSCGQPEDDYFEKFMPLDVRYCAYDKEYRDVYGVWPQPPKPSHFKECPLQKGMHDDIQTERRMALVRQKFMEAKRLASDERLLQSREFQDALEVLSSNRDLFLRFLEEPNSLFSKNLKELHSTPVAPQTKRITVLKPSKTIEMKGDKNLKKQQCLVTNEGGWDLDKPHGSSGMTQPTRIVVLKPKPGKHHDTKPRVIPHIPSPELMKRDDFNDVSEATKSLGYKEAAKGITRQTRGSVHSSQGDVSLLSSVLSNGCVGDESSIHKSENEYEGEQDVNCSDSEIRSLTSRHSMDYSNRFGSPYSLSSFGRASSSSEPSVIREAKKRLSERWSQVAYGNSQEQMETPRSSSTLGEMLAISDVKKEEPRTAGLAVSSSRSSAREEAPRVSSASLLTCQTKDGDCVGSSPMNLSRSKSLPVSSAFGNTGLNFEVSNSQVQKLVLAKVTAKSAKLSFKGKVSSLFFSRNKNGGKEKPISSSPLVGSIDVGRGSNVKPIIKDSDDSLHPVYISQPKSSHLVNPDEEPMKEPSVASVESTSKQGTLSLRDILSLDNLSISESLSNHQKDSSSSNQIGENQNQPSPTSVLDVPFEDDTNSTPNSSIISNAVSPIESVARILEWDDTDLETPPTSNLSIPITMHNANADEQQCHLFVQEILSTAGFGDNMVFAGWHSVDCPVDPILLDRFLDRKEEYAKSRERRSNMMLLFDCVNYALLDTGRNLYLGAYPWPIAYVVPRKNHLRGASIGDEIWLRISDWFSGEGKFDSNEADNGDLVPDGLLRKDVGGNGWAESMQSEIDELGKEITGQLFEELVRDALTDLTVGCL